MGREIITISVPTDSRVLEILRLWQADKKANLSANVCAAIAEKGDLVTRLRWMERKHIQTGELLRTRSRRPFEDKPTETGKMTMEEWENLYGDFRIWGDEE